MRSFPEASPRERKLAHEVGVRRICAVLFAVALGMGLGACSKCDFPVWMPSSCHAGPGTGSPQ
jgi:hypothetical protein